MFDLATIMKAIELVGPITETGKKLYEDFSALTSGETQEQLKARYAAARQRSDAVHAAVQRDLSA